MTSSLLELRISMVMGYINVFLVGKNVSILMVLISINKVYYERSYDLFKLNVKKRHYFCTNLILLFFALSKTIYRIEKFFISNKNLSSAFS